MQYDLVSFFRDDLHIILSIAAGAYLIVRKAEKRRLWPLRLIAALLIISLWMGATGFLYPRMQTSAQLAALGMARYLGLFVLQVAAVAFYARVGFFPALFAATVGYSLQHACERGWEIFRYSLNLTVWLDRLILIALMLLALWLYKRLITGGESRDPLGSFDRLDSRILLLIASVIITVSIVMDLSFYSLTDGGMTPAMMNYNLISSALISLLVLLVSSCHLREADSQRRAEITDQLLHQERARFAQDKAIHDAINIKCHDIRHQIAALGERGYQKQLKEIGGLINIYDTAARSNNTALDVVLSNKSLACVNRDITLSCMADGKRLSFMADEDIYALFGNILDNAIEAVADIPDPARRQITLSVRERNGFVFIEEENFYQGEISFDGGLPLTSKADKAYHGFGTQSIRLLTEHYDGDLRIVSDSDIFRLSIMLPAPDSAAA